MADHQLRPIERTVRRLRAAGLPSSEIAWRLRRSPGFVQRVEALSVIERRGLGSADGGDGGRQSTLRPIERCVLNSLGAGSGYAEVAARLRRSPNHVARIERFANLRLEMDSA